MFLFKGTSTPRQQIDGKVLEIVSKFQILV